MKLMIVDDEQVERDGLQAILQNNISGLEIEQVKNGRLALEMVNTFKPDLVLMDIQMPGMSGLEVLEKIRTDYPDIKFIMVTAYAEFDYAQRALKLGAADYVLKPSKASDIVSTVGKVLRQIEEEREALKKNDFEHDAMIKVISIVETDVVTQLLFDHVHEIHLNELIGLFDIQEMNETFVMSVLLPVTSEHTYSEIKDKVRKMGRSWIGALYGRQLPIIVFRNQNQTFRAQAVSVAREILSVAKSEEKLGWFIGIGNVYNTLDLIKQSYQESLIATKDMTIPSKFSFYSELPAHDPRSDGFHDKEREKQFFDDVRSGQWESVYSNIMGIIQSYENQNANLVQVQQRMLEFLWIISRVLTEMGIEPDTPLFSFQILDYRQLRVETSRLLDDMKQSFEKHYQQVGVDTIHKIKQYIIDHSHQDISLDAIAEQVGFSPIYISKLFKEQLGVNYITFLTDCRIEKAKKLIGDPNKSLKEITFDVGYNDPNYFSKVFKKMCGTSPTNYRKTLLSKPVV